MVETYFKLNSEYITFLYFFFFLYIYHRININSSISYSGHLTNFLALSTNLEVGIYSNIGSF